MKQQDSGEVLIKEYYAIAPAIVAKINNSAQKDAIYAGIYKTITNCVELYEKEEYEKLLNLYMQMVKELKADFMN